MEVLCLPVKMVEEDEYARVCTSVVANTEKRSFAYGDSGESNANPSEIC